MYGARRRRDRGQETGERKEEKRKPSKSGDTSEEEGEETQKARAEAGAQIEGVVYTGRVKWFNVSKGYGFITPDDGSGDVFVYQKVISMTGFRSLDDAERVEYKFKFSEKGREATHVTGPGGSECQGSKRRPRPKYRRRINRCYNCDELGHHAKDCPQPPMPKRCHHCKSEEHLVADCPFKQTQGSGHSETKSSESSGEGATAAEPKPDVT
ncbi:Protein lin-28-like A [Holothuria leucospilota]|uniref:Protein lin-28-like A n=1 Tax=Holothuria leucospilota TaxID=206669 RepID=A0A9Q0YRW9_HOLLE|nr:Protein lin-28-like A [Holothuria leucospilota]